MTNPSPLAGLRIIDMTRILAGPTCTQLLGDLGADVIKIERPGVGDDTRSWGPPYVTGADGKPTTESAYYLCANRNKRSVAVDITTPEGARTITKLLGFGDVLIENFKVGGLTKYGLSYEDLKGAFPTLIYCSITGFGQTGPNAHRPGYDLLAQGYGGIMSITGEADGEPMKVGVGVVDMLTGLYASTAILAALRHRDETGRGQHIDISLVDTQIACLANQGTNYLLSGENPVRRGNQHPNIVPYQVFALTDGHVIVAVGNDSQFRRFCEIIGKVGLAEDPRFATNAARLQNRELLIPLIAQELRPLTKAWLLENMEARSIPGGPINTLHDVFESAQVAARQMKVSMAYAGTESGTIDLIGNPIKLSESPVSYRKAPPVCGEDTQSTLAEFLDPPEGS